MNTKTMKNMVAAMAVLVVTLTLSCTFAQPAETGGTVEVVLDGTGGTRGGGSIADDTNVAWIRINVINSEGVQKGSGDLAKTDGVWKGHINVSETGNMTFRATAGNQDGSTGVYHVSWAGSNDLNVTGSGLSLTIPVSSGDNTRHIFYINANSATDGWRYLEAAPSDQSSGQWSNIRSLIGGISTGVGTGQAGTTAIVSQSGCTSGAAKTCDSLAFGGYSDWFLPSKDELNLLYNKQADIGNFQSASYYWCTWEHSGGTSAYIKQFDSLSWVAETKLASHNVRAVRAF